MLLFRKPVRETLTNQLHQKKSMSHTVCAQNTSTKHQQHPTTPQTKTHQHAGTLSGKPFSCWVDSIMGEMQDIHWFHILQSSNNTPLPQRVQNLGFMFTSLKQSQKILPFLVVQEEFSLSFILFRHEQNYKCLHL